MPWARIFCNSLKRLTMAKRQEEKDGEGGQPGGERYLGGGSAGEHAQGVEAGEQDHIDEDDALQYERVGERRHKIEQQPAKKVRGRKRGSGEGESQKDDDDGDAGTGEIAGGEGAIALFVDAGGRLRYRAGR